MRILLGWVLRLRKKRHVLNLSLRKIKYNIVRLTDASRVLNQLTFRRLCPYPSSLLLKRRLISGTSRSCWWEKVLLKELDLPPSAWRQTELLGTSPTGTEGVRYRWKAKYSLAMISQPHEIYSELFQLQASLYVLRLYRAQDIPVCGSSYSLLWLNLWRGWSKHANMIVFMYANTLQARNH